MSSGCATKQRVVRLFTDTGLFSGSSLLVKQVLGQKILNTLV